MARLASSVASALGIRTGRDPVRTVERTALNRWGKGYPGGFLELYATDITYFDPVTATLIDGHEEMVDYYVP